MNRNIIFGLIIVILGAAVILGGFFLLPRTITYIPQPGLRAQTLIDLDPNSNDITISAEGITADRNGLLYIGDNQGRILRIDPDNPRIEVVGRVSGSNDSPPSLLGLAFDREGNLYVATGSQGQVWKLDANRISASNPGVATLYATELGFANGIAFDRFGRMLVTDSFGGNIWTIDTATREKRIFANNLPSRNEDLPFGPNGIAIGPDGNIYFANTGNGVIHMIETAKEDGRVLAVLIWRSNPALIGADGISFDGAGNLWVATNVKNAIYAITPDRDIVEVSVNTNVGPLEFPTSLVFSGDTLYVSNTDIEFGANESRAPGVGPSIARLEVGVSGFRIPV